VAGAIVVNVATAIGFLVLLSQGRTVAAMLVGYLISVPYNLVAAVGVWRSAGRYAGPPALAAAARAITVVVLGILSLV
jgi:hypothetical protein